MDRKDFLTGLWGVKINGSKESDSVDLDEPSLSSYQPNSSASVSAYIPSGTKPWDRRRVIHLLRRTNMGATPENVKMFLSWGPSQSVDYIVDRAVKAPGLPSPEWLKNTPPDHNATQKEREEYTRLSNSWTDELASDSGVLSVESGLQSRMFLFWHSHFSTHKDGYFWPQAGYLYVRLIQDYAFGDYKKFLRLMGLESAMLMYLNNNHNQKGSPNTNYARELLELYTLGEGNGYTEKDIDEIARSITGYVTDNWQVTFDANRYDDGHKTIFGKNGAYDYNAVINLLFQERKEAVARHLTRKLYKHFVYTNPPVAFVNELSKVLLESNFVIEPLIRTLLKSDHFFEDEFIGAMVSSPADYFGFFKNTFVIPDDTKGEFFEGKSVWVWQMRQFDQIILEPPSVAGWPGHRHWLNSATLTSRWNNGYLFDINYLKIWEFARKMSHPNNPYSLAKEMSEYLLPITLSDDEYREMGDILLGGIPAYEWNIYDNGSIHRIMGLFRYIRNLPEFQLY